MHTYTYDNQRRQIADSVTTLGSGIDGTVRKIAKTYNWFGALETASLLDANNSVINQLRYEYDWNRNLSRLYSNLDGAVNTSTTGYVAYAAEEAEDYISIVAHIMGLDMGYSMECVSKSRVFTCYGIIAKNRLFMQMCFCPNIEKHLKDKATDPR
ncbi:MAG: hypothetical protein Q4G68_09830 [Planctomycetia bacterium]|nr:hypothetical protein [Planctomycetia bacterium]